MRWRERSCLQNSVDGMPSLMLQGYLCCIGFAGRELRCGRHPSDRLDHPGSLGSCLSTVLQRLLAVLTIRCLFETVGQDLDRNVSPRDENNKKIHSVTQSSQVVQELFVRHPRGPTPNRRTAGSAFVPLAQRTSAYSRSCVKACWGHTEALTARAIFALRITIEDAAIPTVVELVNSFGVPPAAIGQHLCFAKS
jgi:hypothetical protein